MHSNHVTRVKNISVVSSKANNSRYQREHMHNLNNMYRNEPFFYFFFFLSNEILSILSSQPSTGENQSLFESRNLVTSFADIKKAY